MILDNGLFYCVIFSKTIYLKCHIMQDGILLCDITFLRGLSFHYLLFENYPDKKR